MALLNIEMLGAEVLRRPAEPVPGPSPELERLIRDMFETMYDAHGIGLAAPQAGLSHRVIVVDVGEESRPPLALLNPVITQSGAERDRHEEECLSIPGITGTVERPTTVVVEGLDPQGQPVRLEAEGMLARCLQHEIDHLNGVLFIDYLSPMKRTILLKKYRRLAERDA